MDRDVNVGPVGRNWLRQGFQTLNLSFTFTLFNNSAVRANGVNFPNNLSPSKAAPRLTNTWILSQSPGGGGGLVHTAQLQQWKLSRWHLLAWLVCMDEIRATFLPIFRSGRLWVLTCRLTAAWLRHPCMHLSAVCPPGPHLLCASLSP